MADAEKINAISAEVAARLLRIKPRWLHQLAKDGWIRKPDGKFTVVSTVHGYLDYLDDRERRAQKKAAENEVSRARAREIELRTAKAERELVPTDEAEGFVQLVIGEVTSRLQGLSARFTRDLNERERLENLVDQLRAEVADVVKKHGQALRAGVDDTEADEEDDAG